MRFVKVVSTLASLAMAVLTVGGPAAAVEGLVIRPSPHSVAETTDRLERAVKERDLVVVARVDHAAAAQRAGLPLRPTQLLIFGSPKAGTPLMQTARTIGIDLPLKALVWEDDQGKVWLAYNAPASLAARHGIGGERADTIRAMGAALEALANAATGLSR
ncbi:MAG TPA: DUF302 domain-containing protein [Methylomirabilota bacterium]|nr:DUF302 domain-containing protein [Methylomirabilota bacterium]